MFDSSYFKNIDGVEAAIERSSKLQDIDARVKEEHLDTLSKFYKVRFCEFLQLISSIPNLVHLKIFFSVLSQSRNTELILSSCLMTLSQESSSNKTLTIC